MTRVCPERDGTCPHGMNCPYADTRYQCREGWRKLPDRDALIEAITPENRHNETPVSMPPEDTP